MRFWARPCSGCRHIRRRPARGKARHHFAPSEPAESVTVTATPLPGRSAVDEFIYSYPHVTRLSEKIPRWKDGICPVVEGVPARYAAFVTHKATAIAEKSGGAGQCRSKCRHNIEILLSDHPQEVGDFLAKGHSPYLGWFDNLHQADDLAKVTHDVQAWYLTGTVDYNGAWHLDCRAPISFTTASYGYFGGNDGDYPPSAGWPGGSTTASPAICTM